MSESSAGSVPKLSVNLNKVAWLRNARSGDTPSVLKAAAACIAAGAHGITVHPRPDERHIRNVDVADLTAYLKDYSEVEFNIEGNPFEGVFMDLVEAARPTQCTLVPDAPGQATSDHGWDLAKDAGRLGPIVERLKGWGVRVSLFMDPTPELSSGKADEMFGRAAALGADRVELYTETYAVAFAQDPGGDSPGGNCEEVLARFAASGEAAIAAGLGLNAGHDLNTENLPAFCGAVKGLEECSIGHALVADALWLGWADCVAGYLKAMGWGEDKI